MAAAARDLGRTMAELLRSLQDSQLVARFQRRCGLFPAPDEGPCEDGAAPGLGHLPGATGKGRGGPAHGLRRVTASQVTAGQVFAGVGGGAASLQPAG